jgi:arginine:ornithine antiporter / lysine permease
MSKQNGASSAINLKDLSFVALFSLMFGSMMGSGVFDIPQNIAHNASLVAVLIGWAITAIGMLALGWAFVYLTKKRADIQSGVYGYAKHGFGDYVGFNAAWGYWLNALLGNASYLIYIFATLGNFAIFKFFGNGTNLTALICESVLIWLIYILIIRGIKGASIVNIVISSVKILALLAVIIIFIIGFNWSKFSANLTPNLQWGDLFTQVKSTMLVTVWDFIGIEAACVYALRAKKMGDVAKATMLGVTVVLVIDALISILPFGILNGSEISSLATPSAAGVLAVITSAASADLVRVAIIISVAGALLAWMLLATNISYLAAEDRALPQKFMRLNHKNVPVNALLASTITLQIFILAAFVTHSVYLTMIKLATSLILIPYLLSALFAFKLVIHERKIDWLSFIKGALASLYGIWLMYAGGINYLLFSTLLYLIGIIFYAIAKKEQGKPVFINNFEKIVFGVLVVIAIISVFLWYSGNLTV